MTVSKWLRIFLCIAILVWVGQVSYILFENQSTPEVLRQKGEAERARLEFEGAQKLQELEEDFAERKYLATGKTTFDRIFNAKGQSIKELIQRLSEEALPDGWTSEVKVDEFTHFILMVAHPNIAGQVDPEIIASYLKPVMKYCEEYLKSAAVFDRNHTSYLFFDESLLEEVRSDKPLSDQMIEYAYDQGELFRRFDSVTIKGEKHYSHLYLPIEIAGPEYIISVKAMLDTGASITVITREIALETGRDDLASAPIRRFNTANGTLRCPVIKRKVTIGGIQKEIEVAVSPDDGIVLIGLNLFEDMDYVIDSSKSEMYLWRK